MDKETLSNYGWIVICILVLSIMIALATPFGTFIKDAVWNTTQGLFDVQENALGIIGVGGGGSNTDDGEITDTVGIMDSNHTITLNDTLPTGIYTLKYEDANGVMSAYADICSLESGASYDDFIVQNTAPQTATKIGVYSSSGDRVGSVAFASTFKPNLGNKLYSFGALADIHIDSDQAKSDFQNALTYLSNNENVDFICIPGDLTTYCTDEELATYKTYVDSYSSVPVYASTGNHDTITKRGSDVSSIISNYTGNPLYYSFTKGNDVYIMLGINIDTEGRLFTREELQWFYETLETNKDKRCFVFQHVFPQGGSGNAYDIYEYDIYGGTETTVFESLLEHYPNVTLFHGHSHLEFALQSDYDKANYDNSNGFHSVHIPSLATPRTGDESGSSSREELYSESEGYIVDVYEKGIVLRGRDFVGGKFLPIAQYALDTTKKTVAANTYTDSTMTINCSTIVPTWNYGKWLHSDTGSVIDNADYASTDAIPIIKDKQYFIHQYWGCNVQGSIFYYDENGTHISHTQIWPNYSGPVKITPPSNATTFKIRQYTGLEAVDLTSYVFVTYRNKTTEDSSYTNILDEVGYTENQRISIGTGGVKDNTGTDTTGYIPVTAGDIIYLKNVTMPDVAADDSTYRNLVGFYTTDKTYVSAFPQVTTNGLRVVFDSNGNLISFIVDKSYISGSTGYIRICAENIDETSIITVNEPIN